MEKIKERNFLYFWGPQLIMGLAGVVGGILSWIPVLGVVMSVLAALCSVAAALFVTVYRLYFYYQLSLDVNAVCEGDNLESASFLYVLALNVATFGIYRLFWIYKLGQRLKANAPRYGFKMVIGGKDFVILDMLSGGWISAWEFVRNMNRFAKVYNKQGLPEVVGGAV